MKREACLIGGDWVTGSQWIAVEDPATGDLLGRVPSLDADEIRRAILLASEAMGAWAARTADDRAKVLRTLAMLMSSRREALAELLISEQGKPFAESRGEIDYAASFVEWFDGEGRRIYGEIVPTHRTDARLVVLRLPVGVVAAITPWNFPAAMVTRKIAPALAAGCDVVLKPASRTPFTALAIAELAMEAGVPTGLLIVVTGDARAIGGDLTANPLVRKLSFTGSTEVGSRLFAQSAPTIKKLSLRLGGDAPIIVFDDANVDAAVVGAIRSKFRNAGQTCICANHFYAQADIHDVFVAKPSAAVAALRLGRGTDANVDVGPLIDDSAVTKVEEHVADALGGGACIETGGRRSNLGGHFFEPTVLSAVRADALVAREETFGPLAAVIPFRETDEAVELANAFPYGLAAYFYTRDLGRAWRVAEGIEAGMVGVNTGLISTAVAPFGRVKASGLGREGSQHGIHHYLEMKYVCMALD